MTFHLAERIAGSFSFSASHWREDGQVLAPPGVPVRLQIHHSFSRPARYTPLLAALAELLGSPYTTAQWPRGTAIVCVAHHQAADVTIHLREYWLHDQRQLLYEARFPHSEAVFHGSFSLD